MITDFSITEGISDEVVTLEKAKKHLRIEASFDEEDDLIQTYIDAAIGSAENYIGGHITQKVGTFKATGFDNPFLIGTFPVVSVESIKYFEEGEATEQTMDASEYGLTSEFSKYYKIRYKNELPVVQDRFDAVTIAINLGMVKVEKPIVSAVLLIIADMYERREDRSEVFSTAAMSLLRSYKKF